jgi:alpha-beta hydrolase superfamily lysophospholipase
MLKILGVSILIILGGCSGVFYQPTSYFYSDPKQFEIKYDDVDFKSTDGTDLHGWYLYNSEQKKKSKGLILYFHGNAQNITAHYLSMAWLTKKGYDIFAFDYRGYGLSKGMPNQQGTNKDSIAALNYTLNRVKKDGHEKFIVYGQSLGGIISLRALQDFDRRDEIDLMVLDSTFMSYPAMAYDKLANAGILMALSPLSYILVSDEYGSSKFAPELKVPTLVIHGTKDYVVPIKFGEEIYKTLTSKKWFWRVENGKHIDVFFRDENVYRDKFIKFLANL